MLSTIATRARKVKLSTATSSPATCSSIPTTTWSSAISGSPAWWVKNPSTWKPVLELPTTCLPSKFKTSTTTKNAIFGPLAASSTNWPRCARRLKLRRIISLRRRSRLGRLRDSLRSILKICGGLSWVCWLKRQIGDLLLRNCWNFHNFRLGLSLKITQISMNNSRRRKETWRRKKSNLRAWKNKSRGKKKS